MVIAGIPAAMAYTKVGAAVLPAFGDDFRQHLLGAVGGAGFLCKCIGGCR